MLTKRHLGSGNEIGPADNAWFMLSTVWMGLAVNDILLMRNCNHDQKDMFTPWRLVKNGGSLPIAVREMTGWRSSELIGYVDLMIFREIPWFSGGHPQRFGVTLRKHIWWSDDKTISDWTRLLQNIVIRQCLPDQQSVLHWQYFTGVLSFGGRVFCLTKHWTRSMRKVQTVKKIMRLQEAYKTASKCHCWRE